MAGAKITFSFDLEQFKNNAEQLAHAMNRDLVPVLKEMTASFINVAAQRTPPDIGKRRISRKYYQREIIDLKGKTDLSDIDRIQLSQGRRWKVLFDRKGSKLRRQHGMGVYFKSKAEAERARKVYNRGIARAMWRKEC